MDDTNPNESKPETTDPRLKSFLRKASAIIAAERGLNATSRLKLQSLADHDALPKHLFDQAIEQLQTSTSPRLTRYEKSFVQFLDAEFERLRGDVLSLAAEKKAISLAEKKYQINGTRAEQLIQLQAEANGIARISPDDGYAFADAAIVEKISNNEILTEETQEDIYQIGQKWGISQKQTEDIVARQIKRNRDATKSKLISKLLPWLGFAALIGVVVTLGYQQDWLSAFREKTAPPKENTDTANTQADIALPWLSDESRERLAALSKNSGDLKQIFESLDQGNNDLQEQGFQQFIKLLCESELPNEKQIISLAVESAFEFPGQRAALEIVPTLESFLFVPPVSNASVKRLKDAYRANRLLGELLFYAPTNSESKSNSNSQLKLSIQELARSVSNLETAPIDPTLDLSGYLKISEAEVASRQWNDLLQKSWTDTLDAARLVQPMLEITKTRLDPQSLAQYRDDAVLTILSINADRWRAIEEPIVASIQTCDESTLLKWLSMFVESENDSFQKHVGGSLANRLKLKTKSSRVAEVVEAVKKYEFQFRYRQLQPVFDRNELVERLIAEINEKEPLAAKGVVSPDRIAQIALAINIELSFCTAIQNASRIDGDAFSEFDRMIALPSPRMRELVSLPTDRRKSDPSEQSTAMASDRRRMKSALSRLADETKDASGLRGLALNQLERVAHRFKAIPYSDAKILANYFLTTDSIEERLQIEKQIESFSHWHNLALAIADQLPTCQLERTSTVGMIRSLLGIELGDLKWDDWRQDLQTRMMLSIAADLNTFVDQDLDNTWSDWSRLKIYLNDIYRERLAIVMKDEFTHAHYDRPVDSTIDLLQHLARSMQPSQKLKTERAATLVSKFSENQISQTLYAEQLLLQAFATELDGTSFGTDALKILGRTKVRKENANVTGKDPGLAGNELYTTEQELLRMIDLKRKWLVSQLVKGAQ